MGADLAAWVEAYGAGGLAAAAFVGATLVPISSEAAFVAAVLGGLPAGTALLWATVGNSLGCAVNYALGRWGRGAVEDRLAASRGGRAALRWTERWGLWALGLSWLPVVGDPLTLVAGVARVRPWAFAAIVVPLRLGRYALLLLAL